MPPVTLTGTESFQARIQRSVITGCWLMCAVYVVMLIAAIARRYEGGAVMLDPRIFGTTLGILGVAAAYEAMVAIVLARALARQHLISGWRLSAHAALEIAVPSLMMGLLHHWSPPGSTTALSAPILLLFPMTLLISVLRLRPRVPLLLGLAAALFHAALSARSIHHGDVPRDYWPMLMSYSVLLALTGVVAMRVAAAARRYVAEASDEAASRERAGVKLAAIERDLDVARRIQSGLLPSGPPKFAGFEIAGMNQPADQTGGDYYDWQELPNGRLLVVVADVTGHGIGPALVMAVCRAYSRASAPLDMDPVSLMARLNALLHADVREGRFVTLAMAVCAPDGGVELVSAGHGPSLLYRAEEKRVQQFGGDGLPLAVSANESYGPALAIAMKRDDVLVLLTDGVMEWQNEAGEQFGPERIAAAVEAGAAGSATSIVEGLRTAVARFVGTSPQTDDVTIVVIKRLGVES